MSDFIPNSFQMPNAYVDRFFPLLTNDEIRVVIYLARRTFGFGKTSDEISLEQFASGIVTREGERLDSGTGISKTRVSRSLKVLIPVRLVILVRAGVSSPPRARRAACYALQLHSSHVDVERLENRQMANQDAGRMRVASANIEKEVRKNALCGSSDDTSPCGSSDDTHNYQVVPTNKESKSTTVITENENLFDFDWD